MSDDGVLVTFYKSEGRLITIIPCTARNIFWLVAKVISIPRPAGNGRIPADHFLSGDKQATKLQSSTKFIYS